MNYELNIFKYNKNIMRKNNNEYKMIINNDMLKSIKINNNNKLIFYNILRFKLKNKKQFWKYLNSLYLNCYGNINFNFKIP